MPATAHAPDEVPTLVLDPTVHAPTLARHFLAKCFSDLGATDDNLGRLVVTELVTNAYKHVGIGQIVVRIFPAERERAVVIEVSDQGEGKPVVRDEDLDSLNGRGLLLLSEMVREWGTRPIAEGGKVVWAKCVL